MAIIRTAIVDILVTLFIVTSVILDLTWGRWTILVYTILMLVLKIAALTSGGIRSITTQRKKNGPPLWLYHVLYAVNVITLGVSGWWALFICWGAIWILSILIERRG